MSPEPEFALLLAFLVGLGSGVLLGAYLMLKLVAWNPLPMERDVEEDGQRPSRSDAYLEGGKAIRTAEGVNWTDMDEAAFRRYYAEVHKRVGMVQPDDRIRPAR